MAANYTPDRGDIVWLNFTPQSGHEQSGKRPAVVISPIEYNKIVGMALFCPITSKKKEYPFEVIIPENEFINGVILSDQVKSLDWKARNVNYISKLPNNVMIEVSNKLLTLIL